MHHHRCRCCDGVDPDRLRHHVYKTEVASTGFNRGTSGVAKTRQTVRKVRWMICRILVRSFDNGVKADYTAHPKKASRRGMMYRCYVASRNQC
jgi:hypothetical protein